MKRIVYYIYRKLFKFYCHMRKSCKGCIGDRYKGGKVCDLALLDCKLALWANANSYGGN